jgi:glycosyltransferase involved in cell wall biosynthesis
VRLEDWAPGRRISIVLHTFDRGGSGRVVGYLARGFADLGMRVDVLIFSRGGEVEGAVSNLIGTGIPIRYLGRLSGFRPLDLIRGLPKFVRTLRAERPEIVVAGANNIALITAIALRIGGLEATRLYVKTTNPVVGSRHKGIVRRIRLWSYRLIFRRVAGVWTLSPEETREMAAAFPEYSALFRDVANPYVTPAMLGPATTSQAVDARGKRVIAVARLTKQKRLERLVAAFAHVTDREAQLLILGDGEERAGLTALIAALGLQDRVSMPGHVTDVTPSLQAADLFVLTSDYEGLPAAVLEAMAVNCPVVSTDCFPAARSLLAETDGCGIIEDTTPRALGALIDEYLQQPKPMHLRGIAERYSIANGILSHVNAMATVGESC